jgi:hypothetical protein
MKLPPKGKFPTGLPHAKPPNQKRLQSALSMEKVIAVPLAKQPFEKSRGSAISKPPSLGYTKPDFKVKP